MARSLLLALTFLGTACSTTEAPPAGVTYSNADEAAMTAIESGASNRGVKVYWINPPRKPEAKPGG